ncbi:hypothetical protein C8F04DRAFT_1238866 [Mycena alexandri]|uniref:DUF6534 domain-containing protein n=1 Tax=Mycena alexandri TaxID=1745969 RepID=A0AAD6SDJ1_9AGAR|nr:hypothetical protein C8F04DRAFT_1238866 [Mycena alexandri]
MQESVHEVLTFNIATIIGPLFIGNILNWMLMGALVLQLNTYYQLFTNDKLQLRILVYGLFLLDLAQTVIGTHLGWFFIVTNWGNPASFDIVPWSAAMIPILCGLIAAVVQIFYAWRIWVLTPNRVMRTGAGLIVVIAVIQSLTAIITGFLGMFPGTQENLRRLRPGIAIWLSGSFAADVFVTACMSYILIEGRRRTIWAASESLLTRLIHRVVQTGSASVICATVDLALFVGLPSRNFHFVPAYILGKLYTNSLMLSLNLRRPSAQQNPDVVINSEFVFAHGTETRGLDAPGVYTAGAADVNPEATADIWRHKDNHESDLHTLSDLNANQGEKPLTASVL